jgi:hypothetical protein
VDSSLAPNGTTAVFHHIHYNSKLLGLLRFVSERFVLFVQFEAFLPFFLLFFRATRAINGLLLPTNRFVEIAAFGKSGGKSILVVGDCKSCRQPWKKNLGDGKVPGRNGPP